MSDINSEKFNSTPYSSLKLFAHHNKLNAVMEGRLTAPVYIRIKPINICNHRCNYCHYGRGRYLSLENFDKNHSIPWEKMKEIIADMAYMGVKAITFSGGGEPLLYPNIRESMELLLNNNIDLSIITNGEMMGDNIIKLLKEAKWVRISIDAADDHNYAAIRDLNLGVFKKICKNIESLAINKNSNSELGINFVIGRDNAGQVYQAGKLFQALGANHIRFAPQISWNIADYHKNIRNEVVDSIDRLRRETKDSTFKVIDLYTPETSEDINIKDMFKRKYLRCAMIHFVTTIGADCKVYMCHDKAYLTSGIIGDLRETSFKDLWSNKRTAEKIDGLNPQEECQHHCTYDDRNIVANNFLSINQEHINFI
ncbi:MAG: radical SAM protein [Oligoflexia bacterium]|nr:radical SAM protein [Oligoflexia bacterium]